MQGASWITLFRRIPARLHNTLALCLTTGGEIVIQDILRLEADYIILRGRMAGSTDAGRVVIIPYDRIVDVAFTKTMSEQEVQKIFAKLAPVGEVKETPAAPAAEGVADGGDSAAPQPAEELEAAATDEGSNSDPEPEEPVAAEEPEQHGMTVTLRSAAGYGPAAQTTAPLKETEKAKPVSKSILLARLRQRLAEKNA